MPSSSLRITKMNKKRCSNKQLLYAYLTSMFKLTKQIYFSVALTHCDMCTPDDDISHDRHNRATFSFQTVHHCEDLALWMSPTRP
jgi:hypothetical protein